MRFRFETLVEVPRERVFAEFEQPGKLVDLMRGWRGFELVSHAERIREGLQVRVRVHFGPLWIPIAFEHGRHDPPSSMRERVIEGPFARFEHVHEFEVADGGTLVRDELDIRLPWWLGGEIATKLFVAPFVRRMFAFRSEQLQRLARDWNSPKGALA